MFANANSLIPDTPPLSDQSIRKLVKFSNDHGTEFGITLLLNSGVVSGTVISANAYFEQLIKDLELSLEQSPPLAEVLHSMLPNNSGDNLPNFIHLKDAKIYLGERTIPNGAGVLWRGRISQVSGFTMGRLVNS